MAELDFVAFTVEEVAGEALVDDMSVELAVVVLKVLGSTAVVLAEDEVSELLIREADELPASVVMELEAAVVDDFSDSVDDD